MFLPTRARYALAAKGWGQNAMHRRLQGFRQRHRGQRIFLVGGGPSLRQQDLSPLRHEITIAFNTFFNMADELGWAPTYHLVEDRFAAEDNAGRLNTLGDSVPVYAHDLRDCLDVGDQGVWLCFDRYYADYPQSKFPRFAEYASEVIYWGGTVTYMGLQWAHYLGASEIVLLGVDMSYRTADAPADSTLIATDASADHAHPADYAAGSRRRPPNLPRMQCAFDEAHRWLGARGVTLVNATAGGALEGLPRVPLASFWSDDAR